MRDVEVFYAELTVASSAVSSAIGELILAAADLTGEDTGIGNPVSRPLLRLELHRHLSLLNAGVRARVDAASDLAASTQAIAYRYSQLAVALTGEQR